MRLISKDNDFGRYEKRLCVLLLLATIPMCFPPLQPLVTQYTPSHHCDVMAIYNITNFEEAESLGFNSTSHWEEQLLNLTVPTDVKKSARSECLMYNMTKRQLSVKIKDPSRNVTFGVSDCDVIHYEGVEISAVTEFGMVCSNAWQKPLTTSMFMIGLLCGGIITGTLSDTFGRKRTFLVCNFLQFVVTFCSSFVTNIITHGTLMLLIGISNMGNFVAAILIGSEFMPARLRSFSYFAVATGYSIGSMLIAVIAYCFPDWRWFLRFTGLFGIVYIPYYWLIDETPQWLFASGKREEARRVLQKVAMFNHKETEPNSKDVTKNFVANENGESNGLCSTLAELFKNGTMLRRCLIGFFAWFMVSISYYTMKLNLNKLTGDRFLNIFFGGLTELVATFLYYFFVEIRGRRQAYMISMSMTACSVAVASVLSSYNGTVTTVLAMISQLLISVAFNVVYVYTSELFPTKSRQSLLGIHSVGARLGGFLAPFLIYTGESGHTLAPSFGTAGCLLFSVLTFAFLPEIQKSELPLNVTEALALPGGLDITCKSGRSNTKPVEREDGVLV